MHPFRELIPPNSGQMGNHTALLVSYIMYAVLIVHITCAPSLVVMLISRDIFVP